MLGIALLVFREVLEAALIVTVVAAATRGVSRRSLFVGGGIALGVIGAIVVAVCMGFIEGSLGGIGQEVFQAVVLLTAVVMIGWHVTWMSSHGKEMVQQMQRVTDSVKAGSSSIAILLAVVALAVLREGSEVVLFLFGMAAGGAGKLGFIGGVPLGLAGGVVVGFALYFGLLRIPIRYFFSATNWMLVVLASGLAASAAGFLIQANLLPAWGNQLWDTSWLLTNQSIVGQAVHVLTGYEARPAGMQLVFWLMTFVLLVAGMRFMSLRMASQKQRAKSTSRSVVPGASHAA
ncbi:MAG TPA: FTR1 family protein [Rhodanobacteraceae bacterium]|jgi:high-affinity iron transporter|nr:FTR1 family protein [Rhodanobacteraceae bacterium]